MSQNLKKCIGELQLVSKIKNKDEQKKVLREMAKQNCFQKAIQEIFLNLSKGNIPLDPITEKRLKKHKHVILGIAKPSKQKKIKLIEQSGGALGILLPIVAAILSSIV